MNNHQNFVMRVEDLHYAYHSLPILEKVTLFLSSGECVGLLGRSGSGKSTLLSILGLLMPPQKGRVFLRNQKGFVDTRFLNHQQKSYLRRSHIGFVFQSHCLLPEFTALENVILPQRLNGKSLKQARSYATTLLEYVGLSERLHHKPSELSGGEQQRVAIARALSNKPSVLLADEPTGNLDVESARMIIQLFHHVAQHHNIALFMATHNVESLKNFHRVYTLESGLLIPVPQEKSVSTESVPFSIKTVKKGAGQS
ncbi:ABC transporter ATP-binding protein [Holospora undulata]|uniref:Lipoprotein-releasing system ATP-binding protein LolD n=1 Tax=Holospora undulata HU1 TaxID=1321371 RepID=A0A061JHQ0_9PROT|nr:ABC transporter ATP-binding protein [Holospora undulata]ETZ04987.1 lipoprotein-releasing system ATP-binding protein LolD [Holospora undulata HU1]